MQIILQILAIISIISATYYLYDNQTTKLFINPDPLLTSEAVYEFSFVNFTFQSQQDYNDYMNKQVFQHAMLGGIKVSKSGRTFVSFPRWQLTDQGDAIPATLCEILPGEPKLNPKLTPYPSWEMNKRIFTADEGLNHPYLQTVLGFEIDGDILWALDQANIAGGYVENTIKLVKINITTNEIEYVYRFPQEVAGPKSFLNDLVIDKVNKFIYIADSGIHVEDNERLKGALIAVNISTTPYHSVRLLDSSYYTNNDPKFWLQINGQKVLEASPMRTGADGIAMTPDCKLLIFCPLSSHELYQIDTEKLRMEYSKLVAVGNLTDETHDCMRYVSTYGARNFASDGIVMGSNGVLYLTSLEGNGIVEWSTTKRYKYLVKDEDTMKWPDTQGFDNKGNMYFVTNELYNFVQNKLNFTDGKVKYRIHKFYVGTNSYLEAEEEYINE